MIRELSSSVRRRRRRRPRRRLQRRHSNELLLYHLNLIASAIGPSGHTKTHIPNIRGARQVSSFHQVFRYRTSTVHGSRMSKDFLSTSIAGALFGAALASSGVYSPSVITSQMQLSSFHMLKVFITASASSA